MRYCAKTLGGIAALLLIAAAVSAHAGQVWTDTNGDGQPDPIPSIPTVSQVLTVDLWIDSQSFAYTSYNIWADWSVSLTRVGPKINRVTGCVYDTSIPDGPPGIGFAGSVCDPPKHGVNLIGTFSIHVDAFPPPPTYSACVSPIIDPANPYNVFSILTSPSGYMLFQTAYGSCMELVSDANESKSWGAVKGLYR